MNKPEDDRSDGPMHDNAADAIRSGSDDLKQRLDALDRKLAASSRQQQAGSGPEAGGTQTAGYGQAFKLSSEFIAGIVTGGLLGYLIDHFAGTSPWGLIIFILLGFCAGILNVLRSAGQIAKPDDRVK